MSLHAPVPPVADTLARLGVLLDNVEDALRLARRAVRGKRPADARQAVGALFIAASKTRARMTMLEVAGTAPVWGTTPGHSA